jgi:hypothetical protein
VARWRVIATATLRWRVGGVPEMVRRVSQSDGLRELLIAYREHRLPQSTSPPPWSAPRGWPDELLDALKAGEAVVVSSSMLMLAFMAAGLPDAAHKRFWYGGADWDKLYRLDEQDRLSELPDEA